MTEEISYPISSIILCYPIALLTHSAASYYCQTGAAIWGLASCYAKNLFQQSMC